MRLISWVSMNEAEDGTGELNFISAVGSTPNLSYHSQRTPGRLSFLPLDMDGACICRGKPLPLSGGIERHFVSACLGLNTKNFLWPCGRPVDPEM